MPLTGTGILLVFQNEQRYILETLGLKGMVKTELWGCFEVVS